MIPVKFIFPCTPVVKAHYSLDEIRRFYEEYCLDYDIPEGDYECASTKVHYLKKTMDYYTNDSMLGEYIGLFEIIYTWFDGNLIEFTLNHDEMTEEIIKSNSWLSHRLNFDPSTASENIQKFISNFKDIKNETISTLKQFKDHEITRSCFNSFTSEGIPIRTEFEAFWGDFDTCFRVYYNEIVHKHYTSVLENMYSSLLQIDPSSEMLSVFQQLVDHNKTHWHYTRHSGIPESKPAYL